MAGDARSHLPSFFILGLYKKVFIWYNVPATQLNIDTCQRCAYYLGKNAYSFFAYLFAVSKVVSQQSESCVFRARLRAAHFLFVILACNEEKCTT